VKKLPIAVATAILSLGFTVAPTFAASPPTSAGSPAGGSAVTSSSQITPFTQVSVGGGDWNYGSNYNFPLGKYVYSQYQHQYAVHSASVYCGQNYNTSGRLSPGVLASASATGALNAPASEYWNTY